MDDKYLWFKIFVDRYGYESDSVGERVSTV